MVVLDAVRRVRNATNVTHSADSIIRNARDRKKAKGLSTRHWSTCSAVDLKREILLPVPAELDMNEMQQHLLDYALLGCFALQ